MGRKNRLRSNKKKLSIKLQNKKWKISKLQKINRYIEIIKMWNMKFNNKSKKNGIRNKNKKNKVQKKTIRTIGKDSKKIKIKN